MSREANAEEHSEPTHGRRSNEEASRNAADGKADELRGHDYQPLVKEAVRLIVVYTLHGDDVGLQRMCKRG